LAESAGMQDCHWTLGHSPPTPDHL